MRLKFLFFLASLFICNNCFASTVTPYKTYALNDEVNNVNLNGNINTLVTVINGGLDNDNANVAGGYRFFEVLGSLPSAGTEGRAAYLTTNNTLNFDTGSAWTAALTVTGTAAQGDIIYYDGSGYVLLNASTSGYFLQTNGVGANPSFAQGIKYSDTRNAGGNASHDVAVTGTQEITCGFSPTIVLFFVSIDGTQGQCVGFSTSASAEGGIYNANVGTVGYWGSYGPTNALSILPAGGKNATAVISVFGATSFTLTWSNSGSPTGTALFHWLALR